jgi:hypothetical protein
LEFQLNPGMIGEGQAILHYRLRVMRLLQLQLFPVLYSIRNLKLI